MIDGYQHGAFGRFRKRSGVSLLHHCQLLLPLLVLLVCSLVSLYALHTAAEETLALAMAYEKPKEVIKTENNDYINLKGARQEGSVMQFKIKRYTPLSKLMKAYCDNSGCE